MDDKNKEIIEDIARKSTVLLGSDLHPTKLDDRINVTPKNDVEWNGLRGQSFCKPTSKEVQETLAQYGVDGIQYSLQGEPNFEPVALAKVKISDMTDDMSHDYGSSAHLRILI